MSLCFHLVGSDHLVIMPVQSVTYTHLIILFLSMLGCSSISESSESYEETGCVSRNAKMSTGMAGPTDLEGSPFVVIQFAHDAGVVYRA